MKVWGYIAVVLLFVGAFLAGRWTKYCPQSIVEIRDTVTVRDTVTERVPVPQYVTIHRVDTCWLDAITDTVRIPVAVPIERKVYETTDYRAVVEGYRPELISMDIYRQTQFVTKTTPPAKPKRWGIGVQVGYGWSRNGWSPYLGVGIQYDLWNW